MGLAWSPDGEWLAYSYPNNPEPNYEDIFIIPAKGGEPILVLDSPEEKSVIGWLVIPWPFQSGDNYTITAAGADLNLRDAPSLTGVILRKLQPGDAITILSGPVNTDGYTWWQMQTADGTAGWAVNIPEWYAPVNH